MRWLMLGVLAGCGADGTCVQTTYENSSKTEVCTELAATACPVNESADNDWEWVFEEGGSCFELGFEAACDNGTFRIPTEAFRCTE